MPLPLIGECLHHSIYVYTVYSIAWHPCPVDIKPVISCGKGQCLSEAEEEPRHNETTYTYNQPSLGSLDWNMNWNSRMDYGISVDNY